MSRMLLSMLHEENGDLRFLRIESFRIHLYLFRVTVLLFIAPASLCQYVLLGRNPRL